MATQIGVITAVVGSATVTSMEGVVRDLQVGDKVFANDLITTADASAIAIEFANGSVMDLGRNSQSLLDSNIFDPTAVAQGTAQAEANVDAIQQAIIAGEDPTKVVPPTAAGAGAQVAGNEGHEAVYVRYLAPEVVPQAGFNTTGVTNRFPESQEHTLLVPVSSSTHPPVDYDIGVVAGFVGTIPVQFNLAENVVPDFGSGFLYEFQVGQAQGLADNLHGTDIEDGVTTHFTITSLPSDANGNQAGVLLIDHGDNGTIEAIYGDGGAPLPSSGLVVNSGDSIYYFQGAQYVYGSQQQLTIAPPTPVSFNYLTTDSSGLNSDGAVVGIGFPAVPGPTISLNPTGELDTLVIKEDTSGTIAVNAETNDGSHLTTVTISGFDSVVDSSWLDLSGLTTDGATAVFSNGVLTISNLSGTAFSGSFIVTPPEDSDLDAGHLTAEVIAVSNDDGNFMLANFTDLSVITDAVLDDTINVTSTPVSGDEDVSSHTYNLGLDASAIHPFMDSGLGGQDTDNSESGQVQLTFDTAIAGSVISLADSYSGPASITDGGDNDPTTYTLTGWSSTTDLAAAIDALQITVPAGFDGNINGNIAWSFTDAATGGIELDLSDNSAFGSSNFNIDVVAQTGQPEIALTIAGDGSFKEDTPNDITLSANAADSTDQLTSLTASGLSGWTIDATDLTALSNLGQVDNVSYSGGLLTINFVNGVENFSYAGLTLTPPADTDADSLVMLTANVADKTDSSVTNSTTVASSLVVDAILDDSISVSSTTQSGNEDIAVHTYNLGLDASAIHPFPGSGLGGQDTDNSESGQVQITLNEAVVGADLNLSDTYQGATTLTNAGDSDPTTYALNGWSNTADLAAAINALQVTLPTGYDGTFEGSLSWNFTDAATGGVELDLTDNTANGATGFTIDVAADAGTPDAALFIGGDGYFKEDTANDVTLMASAANATDQLTSLTVSGLNGWTLDPADLTALSNLSSVDNVSYSSGLLTINFVAGIENFTYAGLTLTPPLNSDVDNNLVLTANVADITDSSVTNSTIVNAPLVVDAVADPLSIVINVADSSDADTGFNLGEDGKVNVTASFADTLDGSETHTVNVVVPDGFSIGNDSNATLITNNPDGSTTLTYTVSGADFSDSFTVTNTGAADGNYSFDATATGEETNLSGLEMDVSDNIIMATASDSVDAQALVFPAGLAYSIAGGGNSGATLYGIDLATGAAFQIGSVVVDANDKVQFSSLTLNPVDGYLYGLGDQGRLDGFIKVNTATGAAQLLDSDKLFGSSASGMAFDHNGNLYFGIDNSIYVLHDVANVNWSTFTTADLTQLASFDNHGLSIDALAYQANDSTFYFVSGNQLYSIQDGDTTATLIGSGIGDTIDGLSFDNNGNLWGADNLGYIYSIDTQTGTGTLVTTISNSDVTNSGIHSLAISQVDPGTYVTFAEGTDSVTHYYPYGSYDEHISDVLATGSDANIVINGDHISVTQDDYGNPIDSVAIRIDAAATIQVDGYSHTDVFTRDDAASSVTVTGAESGTIQTGEANDIIHIDAAAADTATNVMGGEHFTITTDGGNDTIALSDFADSQYTINAGEALDGHGNLVQDNNDLDTVNINASNVSLDLSSGVLTMNNVEVLDIKGTGDNSVTLTASDVLDATDSNNVLAIKGNVGDSILSSDTWTDTGTQHVLDGTTYNVYTTLAGTDTVTVLVHPDINTDGMTD